MGERLGVCWWVWRPRSMAGAEAYFVVLGDYS